MLTNRSVATVIILTIVTCGIYGIYWVYKTAEELEREGQSGSGLGSPVVILLLCLLTGGIGYLIFGMVEDQNLNNIRMKKGIPATDNKVLYMILGLFIPIVLVGLIQNDMNQLA